jgi:hypothetical protein
MGVPALAQLTDRAGPDRVLTILDLGQQPAEGDLGLPALASDGPGDVPLLARLGVPTGERTDLPGLLAALADRPGHAPRMQIGWARVAIWMGNSPLTAIPPIRKPASDLLFLTRPRQDSNLRRTV